MSDAAHEARDEPLAQAATSRVALVPALRQRIVLILLLIAFFSAISGKPLDGLLMLTVVILLSWDAARPPARGTATEPALRSGHPARSLGARRGLACLGASGPVPDPGRLAAGRLVCGEPMTSRWYTVLGYLLVLAACVTEQLTAVRWPDRIPSLGRVFTHVMRTRTGRVGVSVAWAWVGLHFFAK